MMNKKTIERLKNVGWYENRIINTDIINKKYSEIDLEMPINVELFLREYGMLKIDPLDKIYYDVEFDPLKAIGINLDGDYFMECLQVYGVNKVVYPVGVARNNNLLVLMTVDNEFYCFTDGCLKKVGSNIEEMLDCLVGECRGAVIIE